MIDEELLQTVNLLADTFQQFQVEYTLIGGLAFGLRGRPRATRDADFIVKCPSIVLPKLIEELINNGFSLDLMSAIRTWQNDKMISFERNASIIDWIQPILPVYANVLHDSTFKTLNNKPVRVATVEGIVLTKMLSYRLQDLADIETLIEGNSPDWDYIWREWTPFETMEPERTKWLKSLDKRA